MAVVTDLDGTVVPVGSDGSDIDAKTVDCVRIANDAGLRIACATGRSWQLARPIITRLAISTPCIVEGGTRIVDPCDGSTLWQKGLTAAAAREVTEVFRCLAPDAQIKHSDSHRPEQQRRGPVPLEPRFLYLLAVPEHVARRVQDTLAGLPSVAAHCTPAWTGQQLLDVHVTHREATKGHAMTQWQELLGVTSAQTAVLGDSENDLPLFASARVRIAVGDASPALRVQADYVSVPLAERPLVDVVQRMLAGLLS